MPVLYFLLPNIALPRAGARPCVSSMQISKAMSGVVKGMGRALKEMDMDKISKIMDKFEEEDEDMQVVTRTMEQTFDSTTATMTANGIDRCDAAGLPQAQRTVALAGVTERSAGTAPFR